MRKVIGHIQRWRQAGKAVALARLVRVWGSAPRRPGACVAMTADLELAGSVSGGCVESAVLQEAGSVIKTGKPILLRYGVTDEEAWAVGLTCGGEIELLVTRIARCGEDAVIDRLFQEIEQERTVDLATTLSESNLGATLLVDHTGERLGTLGSDRLDQEALAYLDARSCGSLAWRQKAEDGSELFLERCGPRPRLVVFGAVHIAIPLVRMARELGYFTTVVDPRAAFATEERFGHADEILQLWPAEAMEKLPVNEGTAIAILSHDTKLDLPAAKLAVASPAMYIGALGSRSTHAKRVAALTAQGVSEAAIARIHAPIGLDLGSREPEEIALAILAQITAIRRQSP
jgi:xanthine dehydrogenase accessory factor